MSDDKTFELGLVMAGAISAGAYTAGVMDFLIEALDAFEEAKKAPDWDGPTHTVRVPIMAGASAGGMTSAMSALQAFHAMDHVEVGTTPPAPERNRLYSNWVRRIDLARLLETRDLDGEAGAAGVCSVLCCKILDDIVQETFVLAGDPKPRAWLGRGSDYSVRVIVTLTNLRGVPYSFQVHGVEPIPYAMLNHGDYLDFKIGSAPAAEPGTMALDLNDTKTPGWATFRMAALATGAFPIGLAPRPFKARPIIDYATSFRVGREMSGRFETIPPDTVLLTKSEPFDFVAVDGGTVDNEPIEIVRRFLQNDNAGGGANVPKALVLIAPFPSFITSVDSNMGLRLLDVVPQLASTLVAQSRFKADELSKALDPNNFTCFLISPERDSNGTDAGKKYPIASGVLGGFGGFIDESFRRHDYLLGRRNAQGFLRFHLVQPAGNPIFEGTKNKDKWFVRDPKTDETKTYKAQPSATQATPVLPLIPLRGRLASEIKIGPEDFPKIPDKTKQEAIADLIEARAKKVVGVLVDQDLARITGRQMFAFLIRPFAKKYLSDTAKKLAVDKIDQALKDVAKAFESTR